MKRIAIVLLLVSACSKSDSKKADDPAPAATDHASDPGSGGGERHHGKMDPEARRKRLEDMRTKLDTNGDGKLSPDELSKADGRMKFDDPASLDTNHDGDISVDELEAGMKARRDQMHAMHKDGDDNGSGGSATP